MLDRRKHPFYAGGRDAEIELFLARDGRRRWSAGWPPSSTTPTTGPTASTAGFFGFFECVDRPASASELLDRRRGLG